MPESTPDFGRLALGIQAGPRSWLKDLGAALEQMGIEELWANDTRRGSGLRTLAEVAGATTTLRLAVGVIALSDHRPDEIVRQVAELGLAGPRLALGVGSGAWGSLAAVRGAFDELRAAAPGLALVLAAVGPRMARLGGELADGVLLNWAGPRLAAERRALVAEGARAAGRPMPRVAGYVRVAIGPGATARLAREQARYGGLGGSYGRVIRDQEQAGEDRVGIADESGAVVVRALAAYRPAFDTVVVRGLPERDRLEDWLAIARAATLAT